MQTDSLSPAIEMRGISKTFPGVRALQGVELVVEQGEIHAVVGKNGAGKSTLMNILTGIYTPDQGTIHIRGSLVPSMNPALARDYGIRLVAQHAKFVPGLSVAENIFAGRLPTTKAGFVDWKRLYQLANEQLERVSLQIDVRRKMEGLSVAERQMIEIARAMFADASVIVLDEPTAPLPKHEVEMLFDFVKLQRQRGASFIYISHYLEEVFAIADRVTVLRNGSLVGTFPVADLTQHQLIRLISDADVEHFQRETQKRDDRSVLQINGLTRPDHYEDLHLSVKAGEVVGLTGLEGSGAGALVRGLFGLEPIGAGEISLDGKPYSPRDPDEALRRGVAYLPRDRHGLGIVAGRSVRDNITMSVLRALTSRFGFLKGANERRLVSNYITRLSIKTPSMAQPIEFLSGGNQQKVVVAKLVATEPRVLLLDEPTQGVDVQAKVEILRIVDDLSRDGVAVIVVSDELGELRSISDRILVMYRGRIVQAFEKGSANWTQEDLLRAIEGESEEDAA